MNNGDQDSNASRASTMPAKILVVDDEPDMVDLVQRKFRKAVRDGRYSFVFAEDGFDALRVLEVQPDIDIVVTDINMPRMDGLTLLIRLHEVAPILKAIIVSAYGDMDNIRTAMNRGAFATRFTYQKRAEGIPLGETRVGVNTGTALVGNFGGEGLVHYTAYGDVVNTTARIQDANRHFGTRICVSEATANAVPEFSGLPIGYLTLKGKTLPVLALQPVSIETNSNSSRKRIWPHIAD